MPLFTRTLLVACLCAFVVPTDIAFAQLLQRDRGPLSRIGSRRDERFSRNVPPPANTRAPAPAAASRNPGQQAPVNSLAPNGANTPNRNGQMNAAQRDAAVRSANYARSAEQERETAELASATGTVGLSAPPNRLPYAGSGVLVRLPADLPGELNYLVDEGEHLVIHSGEDQLLKLKGSYEVRFSRGVTADGRNFGEARYTITEGVYRFAVTEKGWELYRETESVADAMRVHGGEVAEREASRTPAPPASPLPPAASPAPSAANITAPRDRIPPPDLEETLPVPQSILER